MSTSVPEANEVAGLAALLLGVAIVLLSAWFVMMAAARVVRFVGASLIDGITRIMGFILVALAIQFIGNGITEFFNI